MPHLSSIQRFFSCFQELCFFVPWNAPTCTQRHLKTSISINQYLCTPRLSKRFIGHLNAFCGGFPLWWVSTPSTTSQTTSSTLASPFALNTAASAISRFYARACIVIATCNPLSISTENRAFAGSSLKSSPHAPCLTSENATTSLSTPLIPPPTATMPSQVVTPATGCPLPLASPCNAPSLYGESVNILGKVLTYTHISARLGESYRVHDI